MYSNFCDEKHTYHLAHYGRAGMKWGKNIFGGRDRAFRKTGVRRVRKNYEWGGINSNNNSFYNKSPNYDQATTAQKKKAASKGFPTPVQPGETFKRRKVGEPKVGHGIKHPEPKKSAALPKMSTNNDKAKPSSGQRRSRPPKDPIEARNLLDTSKSLANTMGASRGDARDYRRYLEAQNGGSGKAGNKRKRGTRR